MEAINYIAGEKNMLLTEDAQIVQGVSGNGCYLPAGTGKIALKGDRNELSVSLWRQWDGVVEQDAKRGVFSFTNIVVFFDNKTDLLTVIINGFKAITDIKDEQKQAHWCFTFAKNGRFIIYKDAKEVYSLIAGDKPVDMTDGFTLGGGKTHATFDEVRVYKTVLTQGEVNGLFYLVSKGTQVGQLENIVQSATPKYLGVTETVPATRTAIITKGERLGAQDANPGDWVLMSKTIGGWKCGVCYRWTGALWINLEPEANYVEQYHACLLHICEIPELMKNTGHFGALFAKVIVAQKATIEFLTSDVAYLKKLVTADAFLDNLITRRLLVDNDTNNPTDFELAVNRDVGILAKNNGEKVFEVSPTGRMQLGNNIFFDYEPYNIAGQAINTPNETVKSFCERYREETIDVVGEFQGKMFFKLKITKTISNLFFLGCAARRGVVASYSTIPFRDASRKKTQYTLTIIFPDGSQHQLYYKHWDIPTDTVFEDDGVFFEYAPGSEGVCHEQGSHKALRLSDRINETLGFTAYTGVHIKNYVLKFINMPNRKPSGLGIVWRDGDTLKIS